MQRVPDVEEFQRRLTNTLQSLRSGPIVRQPGARKGHSLFGGVQVGYAQLTCHSLKTKVFRSNSPSAPGAKRRRQKNSDIRPLPRELADALGGFAGQGDGAGGGTREVESDAARAAGLAGRFEGTP